MPRRNGGAGRRGVRGTLRRDLRHPPGRSSRAGRGRPGEAALDADRAAQLRGFLEIRIFDFWVHERDISTPLGWPSGETGPRAKIALGQVEGSIGYIVSKKIGLPDGAGIVFHLTGPVRRDLAVVVDGRARAVDHVEHPDVELTTDTVTFIQLAAGRIDPQRQIDAGLVTWTGNAQLGDRAARNLRFTI